MVLGADVPGKERGKDRCLSFCRDQQVAGFLVLRESAANDGPVTFTTYATPGFPLADPALVAESADKTSSIWPAMLGAVVVFGLAILAMAVGSIFSNKPIQGSCGGLSARSGQGGDTACSICEKPASECPDREMTEGTSAANETE